MRTAEFFIGGLGVFVPESVSVETAVERGWCTAEEAAVHGMAGAAVAGEVPAPEMALSAARDAVAAAGGRVGDVGMLLYCDVWHQGPDGWLPQYFLQRHLVGGETLAVELHQGCNGVFAAMELAAAYDRAERPDVLVVAADNFGTPRFDRWRAAPTVFGDAASAVLLTRRPGIAQVLSVGSAAVPELEEGGRYGEPMFPPGATTGAHVDWVTRDEEYTRLVENSSELRIAWIMVQKVMMQLVGRVLAEAGVRAEQLAYAALTNLAPDAIEHRWMELLRMPMSKSTWDFGRTVGHLGASDPLVSLHHLIVTGKARPGDHVLMGGIGSGVTISCAVVKILDVEGAENGGDTDRA
ncbi:ketoacyl-ACP synthase III family protein [Nonomuraea sp. SYSU D8015]|uniref:ketoacyl-ACP synthase III family protein n=1 Tax=Nonomuraea sp. SYSU D8015 TaxID=2593644 RepID=UPI001660A3DA|nr:ketoacyl-ACP synthase III family protein [Nonomuraea sp. SYSU D8015]